MFGLGTEFYWIRGYQYPRVWSIICHPQDDKDRFHQWRIGSHQCLWPTPPKVSCCGQFAQRFLLLLEMFIDFAVSYKTETSSTFTPKKAERLSATATKVSSNKVGGGGSNMISCCCYMSSVSCFSLQLQLGGRSPKCKPRPNQLSSPSLTSCGNSVFLSTM